MDSVASTTMENKMSVEELNKLAEEVKKESSVFYIVPPHSGDYILVPKGCKVRYYEPKS